jgi:KaiC/GvpD/RAD55 family RecA-like ATPase
MGQVLQALLMFLAGWSLSQYRHSLRSEIHFQRWKSQMQEWQLQLDSHSEMLVEKHTQLVQAHSALEKAMLRQSELEMALDLAHSKAMVSQKALGWDLQ